MDLSRKRDRAALPVRREPHWQKLAKGAFLGYRRGAETWLARYRDGSGKQHWKPLEGVGPDDFDSAKKAAEEWFSQIGGSAVRTVRRDTVRKALERYVKWLRTQGRGDTADEVHKRFEFCVYADAIAELSLESATREDFEEWRERLGRTKTGKPRKPRSINRLVRSVVAALNKAHGLGHIGNPDAWRLTKLADDTEDDGETAVFLEPAQRRSIVEAASTELARFLQGLQHTGARPQELAVTKVSDFDGEKLRLQHRKGRPAKLRTRFTVLDARGRQFFTEQCRGKLPAAHIFTIDGQHPWTSHDWGQAFKAAVLKVNEIAKGTDRIPVANKAQGKHGASAYSFRHARISELLQLHGIDPLTVAHQTGTSLAMIEKHYFRFIQSAMAEKLAQVKGS